MSDSESSESAEEDAQLYGHTEATANGSSTSFLHASAGEAYLFGIARPAKTSNARLSEGVDDPFTRSEYLASLKESLHEQETALLPLSTKYEERYEFWQAELEQGFSLLFHGLGSKREMLNSFARKRLAKRGNVIVINGFLPSLNPSDLLSSLESLLPEDMALTSSVPKESLSGDRTEMRTWQFCKHFNTLSSTADSDVRPIFLIVHNIDAPSLRPAKAQKILSMLAAQPRIHLCATIDHIRSLLLFPRSLVQCRPTASDSVLSQAVLPSGFAFVHHHTPTFASNHKECMLANVPSNLFPPSIYPPQVSLRTAKSAASRVQATLAVIASMNDNAKFVFQALAKAQLAFDDYKSVSAVSNDPNAAAPSFATPQQRLFVTCRDNFVASTETQFETLLGEFKDHDIIVSSEHGPNADEDAAAAAKAWLWINLDREGLKAVVEKIE